MTSSIMKRIFQIRHGQVPKGYQHSSYVGIIPKGWMVITIGELGTVKNGLNYHLEDNGYPVRILGVGDFRDLSVLHDTGGLAKVSLSEMPAGELVLKEGDIVFVRSNGSSELVGRNLLVYPSGDIVSYSGFCIRFRMNDCRLTTPEYLNFILDSGVLRKKLLRLNQGSSINNLNQEILRDLLIALPPLAEQRKIAKILAVQDGVIELKKKLLEETKRRKKALMRMLIEPTHLNDEWRVARVSDLFVPIARKNTTGNTNILTISAQDGLVNQFEYYKHQYASVDVSGYTLLKRGEFAYNKSRSGEYPYGAIKMLDQYEEGVVSPLYLCFAVKGDACLDFWSYYFEAGMLNRSLYRIAQEGARNHGLLNIPTDGFFGSELLVPPLAIQRQIAAILSAADKEIALLRQNLEQEERKKKALMQLLLTGIVRVSVKGDDVGKRSSKMPHLRGGGIL